MASSRWATAKAARAPAMRADPRGLPCDRDRQAAVAADRKAVVGDMVLEAMVLKISSIVHS
jgi:hypothetical protein